MYCVSHSGRLNSLCICLFKRNGWSKIAIRIHRDIYSDQHLGIDEYVERRKRANSFYATKDDLHSKISDFVKVQPNNSNAVVDNLIRFTYLVDDKPEDFDLFRSALTKISTSGICVTSLSFLGPVIMRMLHYFRKDQLAMEFVQDTILGQIFLRNVSWLIFLDLLYKVTRYADIINQFEAYKKQINVPNRRVARSLVNITMAACYKQNTTFHYRYASNLMEDINVRVFDRYTIFFAALAIKQGHFNEALIRLQSMPAGKHLAISNLKILALLKLKRFDEIIPMIRSIINGCDSNRSSDMHVIAKELIDQLQKEIHVHGTKNCAIEFERIQTNLRKSGYVTEESLESIIFEPMKSATFVNNAHRTTPEVRHRKRSKGLSDFD